MQTKMSFLVLLPYFTVLYSLHSFAALYENIKPFIWSVFIYLITANSFVNMITLPPDSLE